MTFCIVASNYGQLQTTLPEILEHYVPKEWHLLTTCIHNDLQRPGYFIKGFFGSLMAWACSKMTYSSLVKECFRELEAPLFHTWIGHHSPGLNPTETLWDALKKALCSCPALSSSIQNLSWKMTAAFDRNNSFYIAEAYPDNPTVNKCCNLS